MKRHRESDTARLIASLLAPIPKTTSAPHQPGTSYEFSNPLPMNAAANNRPFIEANHPSDKIELTPEQKMQRSRDMAFFRTLLEDIERIKGRANKLLFRQDLQQLVYIHAYKMLYRLPDLADENVHNPTDMNPLDSVFPTADALLLNRIRSECRKVQSGPNHNQYTEAGPSSYNKHSKVRKSFEPPIQYLKTEPKKEQAFELIEIDCEMAPAANNNESASKRQNNISKKTDIQMLQEQLAAQADIQRQQQSILEKLFQQLQITQSQPQHYQAHLHEGSLQHGERSNVEQTQKFNIQSQYSNPQSQFPQSQSHNHQPPQYYPQNWPIPQQQPLVNQQPAIISQSQLQQHQIHTQPSAQQLHTRVQQSSTQPSLQQSNSCHMHQTNRQPSVSEAVRLFDPLYFGQLRSTNAPSSVTSTYAPPLTSTMQNNFPQTSNITTSNSTSQQNNSTSTSQA